MRKDEYKNLFTHQSSFWWYRGMAEINTNLLQLYAPKKSNNKILDAGCGTGSAFYYLKRFGNVVGIDVSDEALRLAKRLGTVRKGDVTKIPFTDNIFDIVVCLDVLYHRWVEDYRKALSEFYRVLKPGGILLIREPAYNWMRGEHDEVDFTKHRFSKKELYRELTGVSFRVKKLTSANFFLFPFVFLRRFIQKTSLKNKPTSDIHAVAPAINTILYYVLKFEAKLLIFLSFPWGSSVIAVAQKVW